MYLRNFFLDYNTHSATGYLTISDSLYKKLNNVHRRAKKVNTDAYTIHGVVTGSLTLINKKDEEKYVRHNNFHDYIIIYAPTSFRNTTLPNTYFMYCGLRRSGKNSKLVKIPIDIQFVLYLELQHEARRRKLDLRK